MMSQSRCTYLISLVCRPYYTIGHHHSLWILLCSVPVHAYGSWQSFPWHFSYFDWPTSRKQSRNDLTILFCVSSVYKFDYSVHLSVNVYLMGSCVVGSLPICLSNASRYVQEFDIVEMTCGVNYNGNWPPVMNWQQNGVINIINGIFGMTILNQNVTSSLIVLATRNVIGNKFSCTTYFNIENKPLSTNAIDVPRYNYTYDFGTINVACKFAII